MGLGWQKWQGLMAAHIPAVHLRSRSDQYRSENLCQRRDPAIRQHCHPPAVLSTPPAPCGAHSYLLFSISAPTSPQVSLHCPLPTRDELSGPNCIAWCLIRTYQNPGRVWGRSSGVCTTGALFLDSSTPQRRANSLHSHSTLAGQLLYLAILEAQGLCLLVTTKEQTVSVQCCV